MTKIATDIRNQLAVAGLNAWANSSRIAGFSAVMLGVFFIYGVGFAGPEILHNAAHDGRHSIAFPCH